jgi:hypothetical protein
MLQRCNANMEPDEHFKHVQRGQLIKTINHLLNARKSLLACDEHARLARSANEHAEVAYLNLTALLDGISETIKTAAAGAEIIRKEMDDPNAKPLPLTAKCEKFQLTPFQRMLQHEGIQFDNLPTSEPPKSWARAPKLLAFTLRGRRDHKTKRRATKHNPPV